MVEEERVTVRIGGGDTAGAQRAAGAADILDDHLLAEHLGHRLRDQPGHGVGRPARGERHHHGDGALGVGLRPGRCGQQDESRGEGIPAVHGEHSLSILACKGAYLATCEARWP